MSSIIKLKENRDFRRAYTRAKSYVAPIMVVYVSKNRSDNVRLGITTGKKIGNAVKRNHARRLITAAFRSCLPNIRKGSDIVIVARTRILTVKSTDVAVALKNQLMAANIWNDLIDNENNTD